MIVSLNERLLELLEENNLNAETFSKKIGVSSSVISRWVRENSSVKLNSLLKISAFFNCSVDFICGRTYNQGKFNPAPTTFPDRLAALIVKSGEKKCDIFPKLGLDRHALYDWQKGCAPRSVNLIAVADYFGVTVDYLIGLEK